MKQIELKTIQATQPDEAIIDVRYRDYITVIMRSPMQPERGATIEEIEKSLRVLNALNQTTDDFLELEDADHAFMCQKIKASHFNFIDQAFLNFVNDVCAA